MVYINLDSAAGYSLAKKYAADAKDELQEEISDIITSQGREEDFDVIMKAYDDMPVSQKKLQATATFCTYLSTLNDTQKIKDGIDKVIALRNAIPQQYRTITDPVVKAALQKVATAKGGEIQTYVDNDLK